jgi:predicted dehydrogenase
VLGAARIAELAIVKPARATGMRLVAVAARDQERATTFAAQHGVERVLPSYDDVLAARDVEAVYNPLPNGLHGRRDLAAIKAGKHVLSEKPFTANAEKAVEVSDAAHRADVVVVEGFHYLFHPVTRRLYELTVGLRGIGRTRTRRDDDADQGPGPAALAGLWRSPAAQPWTSAATACMPSACSLSGVEGNRVSSLRRQANGPEPRAWTSGSRLSWFPFRGYRMSALPHGERSR